MKQALAGLGVAVVLTAGFAPAQGQGPKPAGGVSLSDLSWPEAESVLTPSSVVIIPLGVATVQHGPHLKLNNNERLARYLASRVQAASPVVIAPALTYHFYPTFLEYPGSTSVSQNTSRDMTVDIVRSFARYGPRRFYILNTGVTTMFPLAAAAQTLAEYGILLGYTGRGKIGFMFAADGDMRHPDGTIERSPDVIRQNRQELFRKKEYRGSVHPVQLNDIRCLGGGIAVADGKWELRLADPLVSKPYAGWCTLVLRGSGDSWSIEAWRYTVDPPPNTTPAPTILKKPGWPGGPGGE